MIVKVVQGSLSHNSVQTWVLLIVVDQVKNVK